MERCLGYGSFGVAGLLALWLGQNWYFWAGAGVMAGGASVLTFALLAPPRRRVATFWGAWLIKTMVVFGSAYFLVREKNASFPFVVGCLFFLLTAVGGGSFLPLSLKSTTIESNTGKQEQ